MTAYFLAIIANIFWAIVNVVDKYLVEKFCKDGSVGSVLILSSFFPVILIPFSYFLSAESVFITFSQSFVLFISGILTTTWIYFYLRALQDESVVTVIPILQLSPVFSLILAMLVLKEFPSDKQLIAGLLIIVGSLILSFEKSKNRVKVNLLLYVGAAAAVIALMNVLFKYVALEVDFWTSIFWHASGTFFTGCLLFIFNVNYRESFIDFIKTNWGIGIGLNALNEFFTIIGDVIFAYAILLAPLAIVHSMEGFQPIFVLFISYLLIRFRVPYFSTYIHDHGIPTMQLLFGFIFIIIGGMFLASFSI